jgi:hypothetical protein
MSSKAARTTTEPASKTSAGMIPTVMYDSVNNVIIVEVVVAQSPRAGKILISAPPVTIPTGRWTVSWELMVSTSGLIASFANPGIVLPTTLPPSVTCLATTSVSEGRWTAQFDNEVVNVESFHYEIGIDSVSNTGTHRGQIHVMTYQDPTIAVVKDPIDPPPP